MATPVSFSESSRFQWKVKNIFSEDVELSEIFGFHASLWRLSSWKIHTVEGTDVIRIFLRTELTRGPFRDFTSRVFIVDKNQTPQFVMERVCKRKRGRCHECVWHMDMRDLRKREEVFSVNGAVSFVCILMLETSSSEAEYEEKNSVEKSINAKAEDAKETFILDFRRLLEDSVLSDVNLKCGERTIPAHRVILSARSDVFAAMFRSDMAESRTGVIEVTDMDASVLEQFLQFIYSCKLPDMSMDAAPQLYEAADKYGVEPLKKICSAFMAENLTEGNACSILLLSDAHGDCDLKDRVVAFIVKTKLFKKEDLWLEFCEDHPKLTSEILNRVCKTFSCFL